ncbi:alpha-beta hydrolase superfamily lysophospholipase [Ottowia thiooxydans]|uniref:Alpha-beta hydrolase superfamily lysophospholipase n=2 Tax=Ottowia thiooxydans TaxID=219182 RepID=A0ABV2QA00_9BURK
MQGDAKKMNRRELLAVPMQSTGEMDVQSGVARRAGLLWCTRHRASGIGGPIAKTAVVVVHPSSNFMGHYALDALAECGVDAVGMSTRYIGNEAMLILEHCVVDIGSVIRHLRTEGYQRVVLIGNSGGGGLVALYQNQAEKPTITAPPAGGPPDLTKADLPPADALIMLMAHPSRNIVLTEKLDPAILDEHEPFRRDPELDLFNPDLKPPYTAAFLARYKAAQLARSERITQWALDQLALLKLRADPRLDDLPFVVHGTMADPRNLDLTLDPSDRAPTTQWGPPAVANFIPASIGHYTSLRSWLSQWSMRLSNGHGPERLNTVQVPVHVIYGTADPGCYPGHAKMLYEGVKHDRKWLTPIQGAKHYLFDQPEHKRTCCKLIADWCHSLP